MHLYCSGKLTQRPVDGHYRDRNICRIILADTSMKFRFLTDTGANILVIPKSVFSYLKSPDNLVFYAPNWSSFKTYATHFLSIDLYLRRSFKWSFVTADGTQFIICTNFFTHYNLLIHVKNKRLIDSLTNLSSKGEALPISSFSGSLSLINGYSMYHKFLSEFPSITNPSLFKQCIIDQSYIIK